MGQGPKLIAAVVNVAANVAANVVAC